MPRIKGQNRQVCKVREDLEAALAALADHDECAPFVSLRLGQAIRRTGFLELPEPAQLDLERMVSDVADARAQVVRALERMME